MRTLRNARTAHRYGRADQYRGGGMRRERSIDGLSGLAPLLRVRPELQAICRFGRQWVSERVAEGGR